ncbi:hypothetical protein [Parasedimentitalea maritima]|uniref:Uncharacterized protein n=1 Tax=Parasedimentitalea maritima TaxID=2578117 RepID=A0A6A4RE78_9RHOB|nr:hypothetical protein [Zongyanglinia marina]KAE9625937.1 hypothetical protein GP644_22035 [Zongyanglinia marina]
MSNKTGDFEGVAGVIHAILLIFARLGAFKSQLWSRIWLGFSRLDVMQASAMA